MHHEIFILFQFQLLVYGEAEKRLHDFLREIEKDQDAENDDLEEQLILFGGDHDSDEHEFVVDEVNGRLNIPPINLAEENLQDHIVDKGCPHDPSRKLQVTKLVRLLLQGV